MCGRYGRRGDKQRIAEWMQTHNTNVFDEFDETNLAPSFNVAPQSFQPVVRLSSETGERELTVSALGPRPVLVEGREGILQHYQFKIGDSCNESSIPRGLEESSLSDPC